MRGTPRSGTGPRSRGTPVSEPARSGAMRRAEGVRGIAKCWTRRLASLAVTVARTASARWPRSACEPPGVRIQIPSSIVIIIDNRGRRKGAPGETPDVQPAGKRRDGLPGQPLVPHAVRSQAWISVASCGRPGRPGGTAYETTRYGEGGIRTLDGGVHPHNALAGRRLQPLGHFSRSQEDIGRRGPISSLSRGCGRPARSASAP